MIPQYLILKGHRTNMMILEQMFNTFIGTRMQTLSEPHQTSINAGQQTSQ